MSGPQDTLKAMVGRFAVRGELRDVHRHGNGHIHDTYYVETADAGETVKYLLQKLNQYVFRDQPGLSQNMASTPPVPGKLPGGRVLSKVC